MCTRANRRDFLFFFSFFFFLFFLFSFFFFLFSLRGAVPAPPGKVQRGRNVKKNFFALRASCPRLRFTGKAGEKKFSALRASCTRLRFRGKAPNDELLLRARGKDDISIKKNFRASRFGLAPKVQRESVGRIKMLFRIRGLIVGMRVVRFFFVLVVCVPQDKSSLCLFLLLHLSLFSFACCVFAQFLC